MTAASASATGSTTRLTGAPPAPSRSSNSFVCFFPPPQAAAHNETARQRQSASGLAPSRRKITRTPLEFRLNTVAPILSSPLLSSSEKLPAVQKNRHGAVAHKFDLHHAPETPGRNALDASARFGDEELVERLGQVRRRSIYPGRPTPAPHVAVERELRDDEQSAARIHDRAVHASFVIVEDAKRRRLLDEVSRVHLRIVARDADENDEARPYLADRLTLDPHDGARHALQYDSHPSDVVRRKVGNAL